MKSINVPAQITTVEDKVSGNLTLTQIVLMACPIFINFGIYVGLPRFFHLSIYKLPLMIMIAMLFCLSAVRLKGKLIFSWSIILSRYHLRSQKYVFDKNTLYLREETKSVPAVSQEEVKTRSPKKTQPAELKKDPNMELSRNLSFDFISQRKGTINVYTTEI